LFHTSTKEKDYEYIAVYYVKENLNMTLAMLFLET